MATQIKKSTGKTVYIMAIRSENIQDKSRIATLIARTYAPKGAKVIEQTGLLRALPSYMPELSLVAENADNISIFALLTPVKAGAGQGVYLAPLAFDDRLEGLDLLGFLQESFTKAQAQGFRYVFVQGRLEDLKELGFQYAAEAGFSHESSNMLVKDFGTGDVLSGEIILPEGLES